MTRINVTTIRRWMTAVALTVAAAASSAEGAEITGVLRYMDTRGPTPIRNAYVQIWYRGFGLFDTWYLVKEDHTNSTGQISYSDTRTGRFALWVYAINDAAVVYPVDLFFSPFQVGGPGVLELTSTYANSLLDFSQTFTDPSITSEFNLANTAQFGYEYAVARRDPRDRETIAPVRIQPTSWPDPTTSTYTNPTTNTIMINVNERFEDVVLLHEYGHHLESQISSVSNWPSYHDGCAARLFNGGPLVNSPEYAWAEAFPDYFARAVMRTYWNEPSLAGTEGYRMLTESGIETPPPCAVAGQSSQAGPITGAMVENSVAAALWDLFDAAGNRSQGVEPQDRVAGEDTAIFQIFDHELGALPPNIISFRSAWAARGKDLAALDCILSYYSILAPTSSCHQSAALKLVGDFNNDHKTDIALTGVPGWRTIPVAFSNGDGSFNVTNGTATGFAELASHPRAAKLTGDFDGDGFTDIALTGVPGMSSIVLARSNGNGTFTVVSVFLNSFPALAAHPEARKLVGDFDGDGTTDIAVVGPPDWGAIPVAWGDRAHPGQFRETLEPIASNFLLNASAQRAMIVAADFTGDGRTDIVVMIPGERQLSLAVAVSAGTGRFSPAAIDAPDFSAWATAPGTTLLSGDFNGDHITDLALTGPAGWNTVPLLLSQPGSPYTVVNAPVGAFAAWSSSPGVIRLVGDFDGSGTADIALTGVAGWNTLPNALTTGSGFVVNNTPAGSIAAWASTPGAEAIVGDFDGDGRQDIALTGPSGWASLPVAFSRYFFSRTTGLTLTFSVTNAPIADFAGWASS